MSTYTDLHNKIRETINVDYRTRFTNQQLCALNEENVYWGTFDGKVDATEVNVQELNAAFLSANTGNFKNLTVAGKDIGKQLDIITSFDEQIEDVQNDLISKIESAKNDIANTIDSDVLPRIETLEETIEKITSAGTPITSEQVDEKFNDFKTKIEDKIQKDVITPLSQDISEVDNRVTAIENDYLKTEDKTTLEEADTALADRIQTIEDDYLTSNDINVEELNQQINNIQTTTDNINNVFNFDHEITVGHDKKVGTLKMFDECRIDSNKNPVGYTLHVENGRLVLIQNDAN